VRAGDLTGVIELELVGDEARGVRDLSLPATMLDALIEEATVDAYDESGSAGLGSRDPFDAHINRRAVTGRERDTNVEEIASGAEVLGDIVLE
jgi:hypothetical protein